MYFVTAVRTRAMIFNGFTVMETLVNPESRIYKPWLDDAFVTAFGRRTEMAKY